MQTTHSEYGGSGAARWMNCPASIKESRKAAINPFRDESYATEGTLAHEVARLLFDEVIKPEVLTCMEGIASDIIVYASRYAGYVWGMTDNIKSIKAETRVSWEKLVPVPGAGGTIDAFFIDNRFDETTCHVFDLKYGRGVEVFAEKNMQLMTYAAGISLLPEAEKMDKYVLHIVQPRIKGPESWMLDKDTLENHKYRMTDAYERSIADDPEYNPSPEACHWCPALLTCPAARKMMDKVIDASRAPVAMNKNGLDLLKNKKVIYRYVAELEKMAIAMILLDKPVQGFELRTKKKRRKLREDAQPVIEMLLGDEGFKRETLSITELRARLTQEVVDTLTYTPPSSEQTLEPVEEKEEMPF